MSEGPYKVTILGPRLHLFSIIEVASNEEYAFCLICLSQLVSLLVSPRQIVSISKVFIRLSRLIRLARVVFVVH